MDSIAVAFLSQPGNLTSSGLGEGATGVQGAVFVPRATGQTPSGGQSGSESDNLLPAARPFISEDASPAKHALVREKEEPLAAAD